MLHKAPPFENKFVQNLPSLHLSDNFDNLSRNRAPQSSSDMTPFLASLSKQEEYSKQTKISRGSKSFFRGHNFLESKDSKSGSL
jgi:hypothetical protein